MEPSSKLAEGHLCTEFQANGVINKIFSIGSVPSPLPEKILVKTFPGTIEAI